MRSLKAVTLTSAAKAYWMIGSMVATIITARFLGVQGRGMIAAATSWVALFVTFGHLSLSHVIVYLLGPAERERNLPRVAGSVLAITAVTALLGWIIAAGMALATGGAVFRHIPLPALIVAFAGLPLLLWMENGNSLLVVIGDLRRLNIAQVIGTTTSIVLVAVAVGVMKRGVTAALAAVLVSYVVVDGIGLARVMRAARPLSVSREVVRALLGGGAKLHPGAIGTMLVTHASVVLLNQFRPVAEAGCFQLAMQLATAMLVVPMAVAIVAYAHVARDGADGAWPEHRRLVLQTTIYAAAAAVTGYVLAPVVVPLLAGRAFLPAVPLFRILTLSVFGASLALVMAPQWVARGYFLRVTALSVGTGAIGIAGNVLLIPRYGMTACAWMMVSSYTLLMLGNAAFVWWIETRASLRRGAELPQRPVERGGVGE
jgi:O-antigen/teichoic acid export membrane protein